MTDEVILSRVNFCTSCSLEKENAELKEKLRVDGQCEACKLGDLIVENTKLKKENIKLRERLNSVNKSNDEYEMMYRKSIDEHNENIQLKAQISILLSCEECPENKGGYICEKEYNDKCLSQKIEHIKELNEEIAELRGKLEKVSEWVKEQEYPDGCIDCSFSDTEKLKEILK